MFILKNYPVTDIHIILNKAIELRDPFKKMSKKVLKKSHKR